MTRRRLTPKQAERLKRMELRNRIRARKMGCDVEKVDAIAMWERQDGMCRCGKRISLALSWPNPGAVTFGHGIALANGGTHMDGNGEWEHWGCNRGKNHTDDTPRAAKWKRQRRLTGPQRPGAIKQKIHSRGFENNRDGRFKSKIGGRTEIRS